MPKDNKNTNTVRKGPFVKYTHLLEKTERIPSEEPAPHSGETEAKAAVSYRTPSAESGHTRKSVHRHHLIGSYASYVRIFRLSKKRSPGKPYRFKQAIRRTERGCRTQASSIGVNERDHDEQFSAGLRIACQCRQPPIPSEDVCKRYGFSEGGSVLNGPRKIRPTRADFRSFFECRRVSRGS